MYCDIITMHGPMNVKIICIILKHSVRTLQRTLPLHEGDQADSGASRTDECTLRESLEVHCGQDSVFFECRQVVHLVTNVLLSVKLMYFEAKH
jgi:hypothetical protein